jgi:hypothetical protein
MIKRTCAYLGTVLILTGCGPTATMVSTTNYPTSYKFAPGYNPPQTAYPEAQIDAVTTIDTPQRIEYERKVNAANDAAVVTEQQNEILEFQMIQQRMRAAPVLPGTPDPVSLEARPVLIPGAPAPLLAPATAAPILVPEAPVPLSVTTKKVTKSISTSIPNKPQ